MFGSLAPARRRLLLAVVAVVVLAAVVIVVIAVRNRHQAAATADQSMPGPVVLVPGFGGSTSGLDQLAVTLRRAGKDATVMQLPGNGTGDLDQQAEALASTVAAVRSRTKAKTVDVIGYSAGGVVARLWVRDHGGDTEARRVVTLGSPQHGTEVAALAGSTLPGACPQACTQLATGSSLLAGLNAGDETPSGPTWVSIWTAHDNVVVPPTSAVLDGALNIEIQQVCATDTVDHSGLPTDADAQAIVRSVLNAGDPHRPDAGVCS